MALLTDLPIEVLIQVLEYLGDIDLKSLVVSKGTTRRFYVIGHEVLGTAQSLSPRTKQWLETGTAIVHPLWRTMFRGLFNTADCFNPEERRRMRYLTLDGDRLLPFHRLPWAQDNETRTICLRPDASWRAISLTFGSDPITHLDVVKSYGWSTGGTDEVDYLDVAIPPSGLTMGMFYDLLLCDELMFGRETGSWALLLGKRLRSYDVILDYECFIEDDEDMVDSGPGVNASAILFVRGGDGCSQPVQPQSQHAWTPTALGHVPCLFPWQGPQNRRLSV